MHDVTRSRRVLVRLGLAALLVALADQAVLFTALADGELFGRRIAPFDPPLFHPEQERLLERLERGVALEGAPFQGELAFDAELGWCPRPETAHGMYRYDWAGGRIGVAPLARERASGDARAVAVGGSFVRGDEVAGDATWCALVDAALADREVANLGVGGYGNDQALLRWRRDGAPLEPDEVWLGLVPAVTPRNLTQYWPALSHWKQSIATKPRFRAGAGDAATLVPNPARSVAALCALVRDQRAFVAAFGEHDHWVARAPAAWAPAGSHWTHKSALARVGVTAHEAGGRGASELLRERGGELERVTLAIVRTLAREVEARGARFRCLVLPDRTDLVDRAEHGAGAWEPLAAALAAGGVRVHDVSDALVAAGALENDALWCAGGHYGPELNRVVADALLAALASDGE